MNDIKRVVAYSTLSQLGYMMVAMGTSAYSAGIFHLLTHACFKALLFLAAGSVIMGMHHEQDMRKMGGLKKKMPITYVTFLIGTLALCAIPPFAGFYSKDTIIEAAKLTTIPGGFYAYCCVVIGAFVTAVYSFRAFFMTFHGQPRMDAETLDHVHESPWVVWLPLVLLAIPSMVIGYVLYYPMLFAKPGLLGSSLFVLPEHNVLIEIGKESKNALHALMLIFNSLAYWLTLAGIFVSWLAYCAFPGLPDIIVSWIKPVYTLLLNKYGFDAFDDFVFVRGTKSLGRLFYKVGDQGLIDGLLVNGTGITLRFLATKTRVIQSGYLYHYIAFMVLGVAGCLCWLLL